MNIWIIMILVMIASYIIQATLQSRFNKYSKIGLPSGMSGKEVAEKMGVKLEVLHSMLYRAKQWIKKNYEEQFDRLSDK